MSTIRYIIPRIFSNMRGNRLSHLLTALTIAFVVLIFSLSALIYINLDRLAENFSREIRIIAYLDPKLQTQDIDQLRIKAINLRGIVGLRYITSQEGYKKLRRQFKGEENILAEFDEDFLPPALEIEVAETIRNPDLIRTLATELISLPGITDVRYGSEWIEKLHQMASLARLITFIIGGLLIITTVFIVSNTIKLTTYLRRNELETMRLVGATNFFIRGPFILEGILQGLVGSGLAMLSLFAIFDLLKTQIDFPNFIRFFNPIFLPESWIIAIIAGSVILCAAVSAFSLRQFLRL